MIRVVVTPAHRLAFGFIAACVAVGAALGVVVATVQELGFGKRSRGRA